MAYVDLTGTAEDWVVGSTEEQMQACSGDDTILGSTLGYSVWARCMGGNDFIQLQSGLNNFVNGNSGSDTINLYASSDGYQDGNILGGADNDVITVASGTWGVLEGNIINGNNGNDTMINYGNCKQLRGGKDNDRIINYGGDTDVWGDKGADTFVPYAVDVNNNWGGIMTIRDFNASEGDVIDLTAIGSYRKLHYDSNEDGLIDTTFGHVNGPLACLVYSAVL